MSRHLTVQPLLTKVLLPYRYSTLLVQLKRSCARVNKGGKEKKDGVLVSTRELRGLYMYHFAVEREP